MLNSISVTGHLGADPEMRYLPNGNCVTSFPVYNHYKYGSGKEDLCIFRVSFFGKRAENANQFLHSGDLVMVTGRLRSPSFTGRDGQKVTLLEIVGSDFRALSNRFQQREPGQVGAADYEQDNAPSMYGDDVDDLPF